MIYRYDPCKPCCPSQFVTHRLYSADKNFPKRIWSQDFQASLGCVTSDGNQYIYVARNSIDAGTSPYVVGKYDTNGNQIWASSLTVARLPYVTSGGLRVNSDGTRIAATNGSVLAVLNNDGTNRWAANGNWHPNYSLAWCEPYLVVVTAGNLVTFYNDDGTVFSTQTATSPLSIVGFGGKIYGIGITGIGTNAKFNLWSYGPSSAEHLEGQTNVQPNFAPVAAAPALVVHPSGTFALMTFPMTLRRFDKTFTTVTSQTVTVNAFDTMYEHCAAGEDDLVVYYPQFSDAVPSTILARFATGGGGFAKVVNVRTTSRVPFLVGAIGSSPIVGSWRVANDSNEV